VSFEEFESVMLVAEENASRWDMLNKILFSVTMRNLYGMGKMVSTPLTEAAKPIQELAKRHSYSTKTGTMVCTVPFRLLSEFVHLAVITIGFRLVCAPSSAAKDGQLGGFSTPLQVVLSLKEPKDLHFAKLIVSLLIIILLGFYMVGTTLGYTLYASLVHENTSIKAGFFLTLLFDATTFFYLVIALCSLMAYPDCMADKTTISILDATFVFLKATEFSALLSSSKSFIEYLCGLEISTNPNSTKIEKSRHAR